MIDYIRRSLAEEAIEEYICRRCEEYSELAGGCISHAMHCPHLSGEEILKPVESENVQSVKHGEWDGYICSECNVCADYFVSGDFYFDEKPNFCPNCGARMDLKDGDAND